MSKSLIATSTQKILDFLIRYPGRQFLASEIQKAAKISKGGANLSLRELAKDKLIRREKKGKFFLYSLKYGEPIIKQLKVLKNIEYLTPLVNKIKKVSKKIILFGSSARGEDTSQSDIDLFILTNTKEPVEKILKKQRMARKIQFIIRNPVAFAEMQRKEPVFFEEISRGITVWESKE